MTPLNTKSKGDIAVADAISFYTRSGHQVLLPFGDKQKYDLVVDVDGSFLKVQCKFTSQRNASGTHLVPLRVLGGNRSRTINYTYREGDFDLLYVLTDDGKRYVVPSLVTNKMKSCLTLTDEWLRN